MIDTAKIKITKPSAFLLLVGFIVALQVATTVFLLPKNLQKIPRLQSDIAGKKEDSLHLEKSLAVLGTLEDSQVQKLVSVALAALPDEKKTSGLFAGLTAVASASGVTVTSLEFTPGRVSTGSASLDSQNAKSFERQLPHNVRAINASLTVISDFSSLATFIDRVEKASQVLGVASVSFSKLETTEPEAQITLEVYYQPERTLLATDILEPISDQELNLAGSLSSKDIFKLPPD